MLNTIAPEREFKWSLVLLLAFGLVHTIILLCGIALPFGMIYGPLIYLAFKSAKGDSYLFSYLHVIPFLTLLFLYVLTLFGIELSVSWAYGLTRFVYIEFYIIIPLSLLSYGSALLVSVATAALYPSQKIIIKVLSCVVMCYAVGLVISGLQKTGILVTHISIKNLLFVFPLSLVVATSLYFFISRRRNVHTTKIPVRDIIYGDKTANELLGDLEYILEENELYRNSAISLEMLADRIKIPRHHLSHFLNSYLGKSFYQLIAEYRVDYAKKKLKEDSLITIETLAYECGFNSKTSLNKYFKEVTGLAPSQYRTDANQLP